MFLSFFVLFSYVWGNLFFFLYLGGSAEISNNTRYTIYTVLLILSGVGILIMMAFRYPVTSTAIEQSVLPGDLKYAFNFLEFGN